MKTFASVFTIISLYVSCEELHQNVQEAAGSYDLYPQAPDYYSGYYPGIVEDQSDSAGFTGLAAVAQIRGSANVSGTVLFFQPQAPDGPVLISGNITGVPKGNHGFHVHRDGDLRNSCDSMGPHYDPHSSQHGGPHDSQRHIGDLGNVQADDNGTIQLQLIDYVITLTGPFSVVGRGIVLHENEDDVGKGGAPESLKTGNAGGRLGCGIIGHVAPDNKIE